MIINDYHVKLKKENEILIKLVIDIREIHSKIAQQKYILLEELKEAPARFEEFKTSLVKRKIENFGERDGNVKKVKFKESVVPVLQVENEVEPMESIFAEVNAVENSEASEKSEYTLLFEYLRRNQKHIKKIPEIMDENFYKLLGKKGEFSEYQKIWTELKKYPEGMEITHQQWVKAII